MHPTGMLVETLVDEELPPRHRTIGVEPLIARHLQFGAKIKRCVGIYVEKRMTVAAVAWGDRETI
jgi:hypothetical protein